MNKLKAFTLIEIMIITLVLGVIASLALVQYKTVVEKAYCANAKQNLKTIWTAGQTGIIRKNNILNSDGFMTNLANINTRLRINIPADANFDYHATEGGHISAFRVGGPIYSCKISFYQPLSETIPPIYPSCTAPQFCD